MPPTVPQRRSPSSLVFATSLAGCMLAGCVLAGCTGSTLPEPPPGEPDPIDPGLVSPGLEEIAGLHRVIGAPGSVASGLTVWGVNLDDQQSPLRTTAGADGSFELPLSAMLGEELRLHATDGTAWSAATDLIVTSVELLASDRPSCLDAPTVAIFPPASGTSLEVPFASSCAQTELTAVSFRTPPQSVVVDAPDLGPTSDFALTVRQVGEQPEEAVLFVEVLLDDQAFRYPVTVVVP